MDTDANNLELPDMLMMALVRLRLDSVETIRQLRQDLDVRRDQVDEVQDLRQELRKQKDLIARFKGAVQGFVDRLKTIHEECNGEPAYLSILKDLDKSLSDLKLLAFGAPTETEFSCAGLTYAEVETFKARGMNVD